MILFKNCVACIFLFLLVGCKVTQKTSVAHFSHPFIATYIDDYGIDYVITDSTLVQEGKIIYKLIKWDKENQFFIAQNAATNKSAPNLFTRIDYMLFSNMQPYTWGFCFTTYQSKSIKDALKAVPANRENPRKGCGGYPFSRMKIKTTQ